MLGAIDSGWASVLVIATGSICGGSVWVANHLKESRKEAAAEATKDAQAPAHEMVAASRAAEAIAGAAATLLAPMQATINEQEGRIGELRAGLEESRARERQCNADLANVRDTLRQVTERLEMEPPPPPVAGGGS